MILFDLVEAREKRVLVLCQLTLAQDPGDVRIGVPGFLVPNMEKSMGLGGIDGEPAEEIDDGLETMVLADSNAEDWTRPVEIGL